MDLSRTTSLETLSSGLVHVDHARYAERVNVCGEIYREATLCDQALMKIVVLGS